MISRDLAKHVIAESLYRAKFGADNMTEDACFKEAADLVEKIYDGEEFGDREAGGT